MFWGRGIQFPVKIRPGHRLCDDYGHHIHRRMVTGLFSLLLGVRPQDAHEWYLTVDVDAAERVELPTTLGMSQHGDGGPMEDQAQSVRARLA
jgi:deoxyribodipyrimidine photolyase-related protein